MSICSKYITMVTIKHDKFTVGSRQRTTDSNGSGGGEFLTPDLNNRKMVGPIDGL